MVHRYERACCAMKEVWICVIWVCCVALKPIEDGFIPSQEKLKENITQFCLDRAKEEQELVKSATASGLGKLFSCLSIRKMFEPDKALSWGLSFNLGKIFMAYDDAVARRVALQKIRNKYDRLFSSQWEELLVFLARLKRRIDLYNSRVALWTLNEKIFEIDRLKYDRGELTPTEFLKVQVKHEHGLLELEQMYMRLEDMRDDLVSRSRGKVAVDNDW